MCGERGWRGCGVCEGEGCVGVVCVERGVVCVGRG